MTTYKHKHHIIPRHMGGSDDPSNLVELTVEEHAEAHRKLYEEHGRWQDEIAWKALSGQIGKEQATILAIKRANTGKNHTVKCREARSIHYTGNSNPFYGKTHTIETRMKISQRQKYSYTEEQKVHRSLIQLGNKNSF